MNLGSDCKGTISSSAEYNFAVKLDMSATDEGMELLDLQNSLNKQKDLSEMYGCHVEVIGFYLSFAIFKTIIICP